MTKVMIGLFVSSVLLFSVSALIIDPKEAEKYINNIYDEDNNIVKELAKEKWAYDIAGTSNKAAAQRKLSLVSEQLRLFNKNNAEDYKEFDWDNLEDEHVKRMFFLWADKGDELLPDNDRQKLTATVQAMKSSFTAARVREFNSPDGSPGVLPFQQMVEQIAKGYTKSDELSFYWREFYNQAGRPVKNLFTDWISVKTKSAKTNGYDNLLKYWEGINEIQDYEKTMLPLIDGIKPLFTELHAYIRHKLRTFYGEGAMPANGHIPASLLVWDWGIFPPLLLKHFMAYSGKTEWDITPALKAKGIKGKSVVNTIDVFFQSLGFDKLPDEFYDNSKFVKEGDMNCYQNAYDFYDSKDYRVKLCADDTQSSFLSAIDHVCYSEWQILYKNQPFPFRRLPRNPLGPAVLRALSRFINSPHYLKKLDLLDENFQLTKELEINILLKEALNWVFSLPFVLSFDLFRWRVIKGEIKPENYNCEYWNLRAKYQGVAPPVDRDNNDFDPGIYVVAIQGMQYIKILSARLIEYDVAKSLCEAAGKKPDGEPQNDLIFCDISNHPEAGAKLKAAMELGNSVPWYEVLEKITGKTKLSTDGIMEFFKPLLEWLQDYNLNNNVIKDWPEKQDKCH